ncbi:MAG: class I SAM-dependent methyltransferase [Actinomycetota bacterium]
MTIPSPNTLVADRKVAVLCRLLTEHLADHQVDDVLVVGCGSGREAAHLADFFSARSVGIDLDDGFDQEAAALADLRVMDATALTFDDDSFDLVYSFHALEHIDAPDRALAEMRRVLRPGGWYCIGTPNRSRLVGYVGSPTSNVNKLRWNLQDYRMRLKGRFRNEFGAHAGFTSAELGSACREAFGDATEITEPYYRELYGQGRAGAALGLAGRARVDRFLFPCVYFVGRTDEAGGTA